MITRLGFLKLGGLTAAGVAIGGLAKILTTPDKKEVAKQKNLPPNTFRFSTEFRDTTITTLDSPAKKGLVSRPRKSTIENIGQYQTPISTNGIREPITVDIEITSDKDEIFLKYDWTQARKRHPRETAASIPAEDKPNTHPYLLVRKGTKITCLETTEITINNKTSKQGESSAVSLEGDITKALSAYTELTATQKPTREQMTELEKEMDLVIEGIGGGWRTLISQSKKIARYLVVRNEQKMQATLRKQYPGYDLYKLSIPSVNKFSSGETIVGRSLGLKIKSTGGNAIIAFPKLSAGRSPNGQPQRASLENIAFRVPIQKYNPKEVYSPYGTWTKTKDFRINRLTHGLRRSRGELILEERLIIERDGATKQMKTDAKTYTTTYKWSGEIAKHPEGNTFYLRKPKSISFSMINNNLAYRGPELYARGEIRETSPTALGTWQRTYKEGSKTKTETIEIQGGQVIISETGKHTENQKILGRLETDGLHILRLGLGRGRWSGRFEHIFLKRNGDSITSYGHGEPRTYHKVK